MNDQSNQNYSDEDISLIMRAPHITLSETEQGILDRILQESFDQTHPEFDHYKALENLQRNFNNTVALCASCFIPKQKTELEQYKDYCQECYEELNPEPEPEPELELQPEVLPIQPELPPQPQVQPEPDQSKLIELLQQQVEQQAQIIALLQT